jgi:DNA polymerase I-like protein with 3'-5' exonuclease and polymerase domains
MVTLDFETRPIVKNSPVPPKPAGLAIKTDDGPSQYLSFEHKKDNDYTFEAVRCIVSGIKDEPVLFHNAKFDLSVFKHYFDIEFTDIHDTMIMYYLNDPREPSLALKDLCVKYLGRDPDEQNVLRTWLSSHGLKDSDIWLAPVDIVAKYACADVDMTYDLYQHMKEILEN